MSSKTWLIGIATTLLVSVCGYAATFAFESAKARADDYFLLRAEFSEYVQAQTRQASMEEIRSLDRKIGDITSELKYGNLSPERRAQLEQMLTILTAQKAEIELEIGQ